MLVNSAHDDNIQLFIDSSVFETNSIHRKAKRIPKEGIIALSVTYMMMNEWSRVMPQVCSTFERYALLLK